MTNFKFIKFLLGWPLSIISLFFIGKIVSTNFLHISNYFTTLNPFFIMVGTFCFLIYYFLRCLLWREILKNKGHTLPLRETLYLWEMSEIKRYVPGNIWSFLGRTAVFSQKGIRKLTLLKSLLLEAEFFVLGCIVVSLFAFPFITKCIFPFLFPSQLSLLFALFSL